MEPTGCDKVVSLQQGSDGLNGLLFSVSYDLLIHKYLFIEFNVNMERNMIVHPPCLKYSFGFGKRITIIRPKDCPKLVNSLFLHSLTSPPHRYLSEKSDLPVVVKPADV